MNTQKINKIVKTDIKEGLKQIFPQIFEDNKINFDKLRALLSGEIIEKEDDRFYFNWAGKSNLYKLIQAPAYGTLKPDKERSVDFDNTENIVIVGENLETLKLLLKPYFGKVKMIYIDPPYNTGKDFIYRDNFTQPLKDYLEKTGQIDSEGKKLTTNTEASGRYHSDWLNFMYPRLFLARSLLRDDGVIFVSIDDHEVHHLRMIMDEIFGEENFVACLPTIMNLKGNNDQYGFAGAHEYTLVYAKDLKLKNCLYEFALEEEEIDEYDMEDDIGRYKQGAIFKRTGANAYKEDRPNLFYPIWINPKDNSISLEAKEGWLKVIPKTEDGRDGTWRWEKAKLASNLSEIIVIKTKDGYTLYKKQRLELEDGLRTKKPKSVFYRPEYSSGNGTKQIKDIFGRKIYNNPKPLDLLKDFIEIGTKKSDLILDFFAGSGTTGHAVWDLNKEDGGNRKFILVQLDEEVQDEEIKKEFPTVADICIERLRRVSEKYKRENEGQIITNEMDFGFKVFKLDKSNFNLKDEFEFDPSEDKEELKKKYLEWLGMFVDQPLVSGWKEIDVIYEVMLKEGLNLNSKIEKVKIKNDEFYYVKDEGQNLEFYISLKDKFSKDTIEEIRTSKYKEKMFVFLDNALTDSDKINLSAFVRLKVI
jgi:adenine-specific DNA-methyltransferase